MVGDVEDSTLDPIKASDPFFVADVPHTPQTERDKGFPLGSHVAIKGSVARSGLDLVATVCVCVFGKVLDRPSLCLCLSRLGVDDDRCPLVSDVSKVVVCGGPLLRSSSLDPRPAL